MSHIQVSKVHELTPELTGCIERIYTQSFPPEERIDLSGMLAGIDTGDHELFVATSNESPCVGFGILEFLPGSNLLFLDYLAVEPELRNRQIGAAILRKILRDAHEAGWKGVIFEVEPEDEGSAPERELRKRRIGFYERNGGRVLHCAPGYRMPNLVGEGSMRMRLVWIPDDPQSPDLFGETLRRCIQEIFKTVYHKEENDPLLKSILEDLRC